MMKVGARFVHENEYVVFVSQNLRCTVDDIARQCEHSAAGRVDIELRCGERNHGTV